jgi:poly(A) polymerase
MLRAVRFAAKLNFEIDASVQKAIAKNRGLLGNVPAARLFDEFLKLFQAGFAEKTFVLLWEFKLFGELFQQTDRALGKDSTFGKFVHAALINTDKRVAAGDSVTPMFLLGVFLWAPVKKLAEQMRAKEKMSEAQSLALAAYEISSQQQSRISLPRRFTAPMREMLAMQPRFDVRHGRRALNLLEHRRFRAAYDFMMLRAEVGEVDLDTAHFWTNVQKQNTEERIESFGIDQKKTASGTRRRRPRRRRNPSNTQS